MLHQELSRKPSGPRREAESTMSPMQEERGLRTPPLSHNGKTYADPAFWGTVALSLRENSSRTDDPIVLPQSAKINRSVRTIVSYYVILTDRTFRNHELIRPRRL